MQIALPRRQTATTPILRVALSLVALAVGFGIAAAIGGLGPFDGVRGEPGAATRATRALPFDAPVPDGQYSFAGAGREMPYRLEWRSEEPTAAVVNELSAVVPTRPRWSVSLVRQVGDVHQTTLMRATSDGMMTHFGRLTVVPQDGGSLIAFEFIGMTDLADRQ